MPRLLHSQGGFLRYMQMSSSNVFIFVEGKQSDPFFYASVCSPIIRPIYSYRICTAKELPANSGGKQAVLDFFLYLRRNKGLVSSLSGKKTASIFYVDKDVDDIQRIKMRSRHLVYTEHYDVQNYIFEHGNLLRGAAAAASVDPALLSPALSISTTWCKRRAEDWREWLVLCLFVLEERLHCEANYRLPSQVQLRPCGPTDQATHAALVARLQQRSHLSTVEFRQRLARISARVEQYYRRSKHHCIFKGKWFASILSDEIEQIMQGHPYDNSNLDRRLPCAIAATLNFSESWCNHFTQPLREVLETLQ